jgi:hypothetical protein
VIEPRKDAKVSVADAVGRESGRQHRPERKREFWEGPARSKSGACRRNFLRGNREISRSHVGARPSVPRSEGQGRNAEMKGREKSDGRVVPEKSPNIQERWREGAQRRGTRDNETPTGLRAGTRCHMGWNESVRCGSTAKLFVGAGCGSPACPDLSGGRPEMGVPTANAHRYVAAAASAAVGPSRQKMGGRSIAPASPCDYLPSRFIEPSIRCRV